MRSIILPVLILPVVLSAEDFTYTIENNEVVITGYSGPGGSVEIPKTIENLPVTQIENSAFASKSNITNISIPIGVTSIGDNSFGSCSALASISIPNTVTNIGKVKKEVKKGSVQFSMFL
jgi:hypothetical protein